ncbi:hypothetical protein OGATHE_001514, partial [Ogataea polymorpha]
SALDPSLYFDASLVFDEDAADEEEDEEDESDDEEDEEDEESYDE